MAEQALAATITELESRVDPATGGRIVTATVQHGLKTYRISSPGPNVREALKGLDVKVREKVPAFADSLVHPGDREPPF